MAGTSGPVVATSATGAQLAIGPPGPAGPAGPPGPQGPSGNVASSAIFFAGLVGLAGTTDGQLVEVKGFASVGDGGEGLFQWNSSDNRATPSGSSAAAGSDGGTYSPGTNGAGTPGRWVRVVRLPLLNVRWFGATGNGSTDDTAALVNWLAAAAASGYGAYLSAGTYLVSSLVAWPNGVMIIGDGVASSFITRATYGGVLASTNPVNGSTAANILGREFAVKSTVVPTGTWSASLAGVAVGQVYKPKGGAAGNVPPYFLKCTSSSGTTGSFEPIGQLYSGNNAEPAVTLTGSPNADLQLDIKITTTGTLSTPATFQYSKDGGITWNGVNLNCSSTPVALNTAGYGGATGYSATFASGGYAIANVTVTNGSPSITFASTQALPASCAIVFASQPGTVYTLSSNVSGTAGTLSGNFTGTSGSTTATIWYGSGRQWRSPRWRWSMFVGTSIVDNGVTWQVFDPGIGYEDTASSYVSLRNVSFSGFQVPMVLNQTEVGSFRDVQWSGSGSGPWISNAGERLPTAPVTPFAAFTNALTFDGQCEFNTKIGFVDDGGGPHSFTGTWNSTYYAAVVAGYTGLSFLNCYLEGNWSGGAVIKANLATYFGRIDVSGASNLLIGGGSQVIASTVPVVDFSDVNANSTNFQYVNNTTVFNVASPPASMFKGCPNVNGFTFLGNVEPSVANLPVVDGTPGGCVLIHRATNNSNGGLGGMLIGTATSGSSTPTATLQVMGSQQWQTRTITTTYAVDASGLDCILLCDTSGGPFTVTLPAQTGLHRKLVIRDIKGTFGTNNVTLAQHAAEKINGLAASKVLSANWGKYDVDGNGTDWFV